MDCLHDVLWLLSLDVEEHPGVVVGKRAALRAEAESAESGGVFVNLVRGDPHVTRCTKDSESGKYGVIDGGVLDCYFHD